MDIFSISIRYNVLHQMNYGTCLWKTTRQRRMRTVSGGTYMRLRDVPGVAWKPYLQERAVEVARSSSVPASKVGRNSASVLPIAFNRYAPLWGHKQPERFQEFINAAKDIKPLPEQIVKEITALQYRWSDEFGCKGRALDDVER